MWVEKSNRIVAKPITRYIPALVLAAFTAASCVYFNAFYNANRLFERGRQEIELGNEGSGRSMLARSIEKAEKIVREHPESRWADDALRLLVRAHLLREEWEEAAEAGERWLARAASREDSIAAAGDLGMAEVEIGRYARADTLLTLGLESAGGGRVEARLLYYRGRALSGLGRLDGAARDLAAASELDPAWLEPRLERLRVLLEAGRGEDAGEEFRRVLARDYPERVEQDVVTLAREVADRDPRTGLPLLRDVEDSRLGRRIRAELLTIRANLELAIADTSSAVADFRAGLELAPESSPGVDAYLGLARVGLKRATDLEDLEEIRSLLTRATAIPMGRGLRVVHELLESSRRIKFWAEQGGLGYLAAGEAARDELAAPRLARQLFLEYARNHPDELWTAKAILAALALTPPGPDAVEANAYVPSAAELRERLITEHRNSAYVEVFLGGDASEFSYEQLEAGLRQRLDRLKRLADQRLRAGR